MNPLNSSKVCVIGLGYVGLPTAALIASAGYSVAGVDVCPVVLDSLRRGSYSTLEPQLSEMVRGVLASGRLTIHSSPTPADTYVVAVPTPLTAERGADLTHLRSALRSLLSQLTRGAMVILESTVNPGCLDDCVCPILSQEGFDPRVDLDIVYCPERVLPGRALQEMSSNDRVFGGLTRRAGQRAQAFYATFTRGTGHVTGHREAEIVKLAENSYRDVNIAFANEMANLCEELGVDVSEVIRLANCHPRVNILKPGPGVGGHCIAVDPWFLIQSCGGDRTPLLRAARQVNDERPERVLRQILGCLNGQVNPKVAILGLTYKANVSDLRGSPALWIADELRRQGLHVGTHEPCAGEQQAMDETLRGADLLVLLVDHEEYRDFDFAMARSLMRNFAVLDTRNLWGQQEQAR